jgi:hypothetical protein
MMTTAAALMGILPIAIGHGSGGESRRPLGVAVAGGLIFSQIVTLYLTPVLYVYMEKFRSAVGRLLPGRRRRAVQEPVPVPSSHGPVAGGGPVQSPIARSSSDLSDLGPSGRP